MVLAVVRDGMAGLLESVGTIVGIGGPPVVPFLS